MASQFFKEIVEAGQIAISDVPSVTSRLDKKVWHAKGKRAVAIVDAFRYDCALALKDALRGHDVEVEPVVAALPTVTAVGMTALLPLSEAAATLDFKGNNLQPRVFPGIRRFALLYRRVLPSSPPRSPFRTGGIRRSNSLLRLHGIARESG